MLSASNCKKIMMKWKKRFLSDILNRLFLPCMIIVIWLPLIKTITFIVLRKVSSGIFALASLIFNIAMALFHSWKMRHLEEEENEFLYSFLIYRVTSKKQSVVTDSSSYAEFVQLLQYFLLTAHAIID
jgi:hypothetical protein